MEEHRLRPKYMVAKIGADSKLFGPGMKATDPNDVDSPFVLMPRKDPAAFAAIATYMDLCEPRLANEIRAWLRNITAAEPIFGTQGKRNLAAIRAKRLLEL